MRRHWDVGYECNGAPSEVIDDKCGRVWGLCSVDWAGMWGLYVWAYLHCSKWAHSFLSIPDVVTLQLGGYSHCCMEIPQHSLRLVDVTVAVSWREYKAKRGRSPYCEHSCGVVFPLVEESLWSVITCLRNSRVTTCTQSLERTKGISQAMYDETRRAASAKGVSLTRVEMWASQYHVRWRSDGKHRREIWVRHLKLQKQRSGRRSTSGFDSGHGWGRPCWLDTVQIVCMLVGTQLCVTMTTNTTGPFLERPAPPSLPLCLACE